MPFVQAQRAPGVREVAEGAFSPGGAGAGAEVDAGPGKTIGES